MPIYDVENRYSYYKTYSDNILVGSPKPTIGSSVWERGVSGSVVSGSTEWKAATLLSDYLYEKNNPFFRSGEVRYLRLNSSTQTLKDSITPNIVDIFLTGSYGNGTLIYGSGQTIGVFGPGIRLKVSVDGAGLGATNTEWFVSSPFEKKYQGVRDYNYNLIAPITVPYSEVFVVTPSIPLPDLATVDYQLTPIAAEDVRFVLYLENKEYGIDIYQDQTGSYNGSIFTNSGEENYFIPTLQNKTLAQKLFFGINTKPLGRRSLQYSTVLPNTILVDRYNFCTGSIIQGWKYGLYNGLPTNFSAVFRQNHYGQFRDMLEQRIYTKTYNNPEVGGPMDANGGISFISGSALTGESDNWLTASIYGGTNVDEAYRVNPYGSGIYDIEYRASQPWHAEDTRITVRSRR